MCRCNALAAVALLLAAQAARAADPYKPTPGPHAVASFPADWRDAARRGGAVTVPVKLYYPKGLADLKEPAPLIVFSHGLGGSREGYQVWAEHWASHGYNVVLPTHAGSDTTAVVAALRTPDAANAAVGALINVQTALRRVQDVNFVITHMEEANRGALDDPALAAFKGKVDVKHIGMAGHSFGAATTLMIAGESDGALGRVSVADARVTAAIAMSPQPAARGDQKAAFGGMKVPVFHMTGTLDDAPPGLGSVKAADRRIPFDNTTQADTCLVIFKGATHMTFSARAGGQTAGAALRGLINPASNTAEQEANVHTLIKESTTAFWDAHLKSDAQAKAWLQNDFAQVMGAAGTFERKKQ
jgi:predicted dienelactone hydrolase